MNTDYDLIVVGGGGAGLMCAITAGKRGLKVLLLEGNKQLGRKVLISGGGRCNFTNLDVSPESFVSQNKHFFKSALSRFSPYDFIDMLDEFNIKYYEKKLGQLFCVNSARDIVVMFEKYCKRYNVEISLMTKVDSVKKDNDLFILNTSKGDFSSKKLVMATGGLSLPSIGATDFGMKVAKQFGHKLIETRPALVPFKLNDSSLTEHSELSGISLPCRIFTDKIAFDDDILFTHKGLSGPATLKISLYWLPGEKININFLPTVDIYEYLLKTKKKKSKINIFNALKELFPKRFLEKWIEEYIKNPKLELANFKDEELKDFALKINSWEFIPEGTEGYRKAEVTVGGVSTDKVSSKTMESQLVDGLYFIGEVLDVTGWLGGYNFHWAWASGNAAGMSI
jgi:predicted Rossmann fold flavoprotein